MRALSEVLRLRRLQVWNHHPVGAQNLVAKLGRLNGIEVGVASSAQQAVDGADVVCTVSAAREPILRGAWLAAGQHVNLVGATVASAREADDDVVRRSRYFVDACASAAVQAGEWLHAVCSGVVRADHLQGEIGEVLLGAIHGWLHKEDITVYKSLGDVAQDLATSRCGSASGAFQRPVRRIAVLRPGTVWRFWQAAYWAGMGTDPSATAVTPFCGEPSISLSE